MKNRFFALWLALICVIMFILQNYVSGFTDLLVLNEQALNGQIWRFLSAIFLHGGLSHIVYNMFALILFGLILEKLIGSRKFLLIFLLSGIVANIIGVFFYTSSLGASGAIMGIIGALTIRKPLMVVVPIMWKSSPWITPVSCIRWPTSFPASRSISRICIPTATGPPIPAHRCLPPI